MFNSNTLTSSILIESADHQLPDIGGEMEVDLMTLIGTGNSVPAWPFANCQTVTSGRTAIKLILETIEERGTFLLPSYLCSSILQPFRECDIPFAFYKINDNLSIDVDDLLRHVESVHPIGLLFINYFGFPVTSREADVLRQLKQQCWIVEDCVQGSLIEAKQSSVGNIGDFVITSFRKYLPVPDGGLLINRTDISLPQLPPEDSDFVRLRILGKLLRYETLHRTLDRSQLEEMYLALFTATENNLDIAVPLRGMSQVSSKLLGIINPSDAMIQRQENFSVLLNTFIQDPQMQLLGSPVIVDLPPEVSPLAFPIRVAAEARDLLRRELRTSGVYCPIHWHLPTEIGVDQFIKSKQLSQQILSLPIDQRYNARDMLTLIERLVQSWRNIT